MPFKKRISKILTLEEFNELQKTDRDNRRTSSFKQSGPDQKDISGRETSALYQKNTVVLAKRTLSPNEWEHGDLDENIVPKISTSSWRSSSSSRMKLSPGDTPVRLDDTEGPLFDMSIVSVTIHSSYRPHLAEYPRPVESATIKTTGAHYYLTKYDLSLRCRINPRTNEYYSNEGFPDRVVASIEFDIPFQWFEMGSPESCTTRYCVLFGYVNEENYVRFEFRSDSLFFMTYVGDGGYFSYVHRNEIADPEWRKEWSIHLENVNPSLDDPHPQAKLHRMWTDGYGGSLHAYVCGLVDHFRDESTNDDETHIYLGYPAERGHRPRPVYPPPDAPASDFLRYYRQFDLYQFDLDGDLDEHDDTYYPQMAHMVFPPRRYNFDYLYADDSRPFIRNFTPGPNLIGEEGTWETYRGIDDAVTLVMVFDVAHDDGEYRYWAIRDTRHGQAGHYEIPWAMREIAAGDYHTIRSDRDLSGTEARIAPLVFTLRAQRAISDEDIALEVWDGLTPNSLYSIRIRSGSARPTPGIESESFFTDGTMQGCIFQINTADFSDISTPRSGHLIRHFEPEDGGIRKDGMWPPIEMRRLNRKRLPFVRSKKGPRSLMENKTKPMSLEEFNRLRKKLS